MIGQTIGFGMIDFANRDREPIHIPAAIQPHGALLTLDARDLRIVHAGGDTAGLLGSSPMALLGAPVEDVFSPAQQDRLRYLLDAVRSMVRPVCVFSMPAEQEGTMDVIAHLSDGLLVLEFEPRRIPSPENAVTLVQSMTRRVQQAGSFQMLFDTIASEVREVTGFDRVMVYRFAPDDSGKVVAEARAANIESFLGLHFPATDIPRQVRALYLANWVRHIPDARYAPAPIVPPLNPLNGRPLDLSLSVLRSVSPEHRQFLANMGVVASLSVSLILRGQLWGIIACHHRAPRYLPHRMREVCELFAEMTSSHLEVKLVEADLEARVHSTRVLGDLVGRISQEADLAGGLLRFRLNLLDLVPAAGVGLWAEGRFSGIGTTPSPDQVGALVNWLNATAKEGVFCTDRLPAIYPPARAFPAIASGLLALSVSKTGGDYALWFRPEISETVAWGGDPDELAGVQPDSAILTRRNSFAAWRESVRQRACPWLAVELDAARRLRLILLEVVLQRIDQTAREREAARLAQAKLTKELDLRLEESRATAQALQQETERRVVVEADLSQVLRRTVADQEAERLRIARELHDTLGQSLTLLQLGLEGLGRASAGGENFQERLVALKTLATEFGHDINRLAWEIRPTVLDDLGIQTAIRNFLETWSERSSVQFDLHLTLESQRLPTEIETTLYRVLQEALTNVVRHAEATRVGVVLGATAEFVTMIIEDDGRGFVGDDTGLKELPSKRLGLLGIRERLALVGGLLEIESAPGFGTTLFIRIPL